MGSALKHKISAERRAKPIKNFVAKESTEEDKAKAKK
jgi:hypothetical protein